MPSIIELAIRDFDGTGAGIGHGGPGQAIVEKLNETIARVNIIESDDATAFGTGVSIEETPGTRKMVIKCVNTPVVLVDEAGVVAYGGLKVADLPAGAIMFLGATADLAVTKTSAGVNDDWDGDFGIGIVTATNDATLTTTEQNLLPSTATPQAIAGAAPATGLSTNTEAAVVLDGTTTPIPVFVNFLVDDADQDVTVTPCNLILNGTITVVYASLGDF